MSEVELMRPVGSGSPFACAQRAFGCWGDVGVAPIWVGA